MAGVEQRCYSQVLIRLHDLCFSVVLTHCPQAKLHVSGQYVTQHFQEDSPILEYGGQAPTCS